ncbi:MAG: hypothetical protein AAGH76_03395 [Pseudomonadota bacterium]
MSISKRNSRKIVVGDGEYRWSPSQDSGFMVLTVQHAYGNGRKIEAAISDDRNVVIENGSYTIEVGDPSKLTITPRLVRKVIEDAHQLGWIPTQKGKTMELYLNDDSMLLEQLR